MRLIRWERFRPIERPVPPSASRPPRMPWRSRAQDRTPASAVAEIDGEFVVRARMRGLADGDVMLMLDEGVLVIQGEVEQGNPAATFKGIYTCRFALPGDVDVKRMRMTRQGDLVTIHVPRCRQGRP
jgi:HSP20 family molecular chaperone IbpA